MASKRCFALVAVVAAVTLSSAPAAAWPISPGSCNGPASDAHSWFASPNPPFFYRTEDGSPLEFGKRSLMLLTSTNATANPFVGFFVHNHQNGTLLNASNTSRLFYGCGMGHTGKAKKATSRFFFTPWAAGDLTLTGYAVATLSPKIWYDVATTFTVAPAPVPASVVRPAPEPERMRVLFGTEITLRSVNFTKFRDPHNDLPSQAGRYFTEKAFLDFSSSTIGWALFTVSTNISIDLPAGALDSSAGGGMLLSSGVVASVGNAVAAAANLTAAASNASSWPMTAVQLPSSSIAATAMNGSVAVPAVADSSASSRITVRVSFNVSGLNTTANQAAGKAVWDKLYASRRAAAALLAAALPAGGGPLAAAANVTSSGPFASAVMKFEITFSEYDINTTALAATIYNISRSTALNTYLSSKGADLPPLGGIDAMPVVATDLLSASAAPAANAEYCNANRAWCMRWIVDAAAKTVLWNVTARTKGYITLGFAERYNVMSPADVYGAWIDPATGAAVLSRRYNRFGYDDPLVVPVPAAALAHSVSASSSASSSGGTLNAVFTTPLPESPVVNFIWSVADAVPQGGVDAFLVVHGPGIERDFGAALVNLMCSNSSACVLAAPEVEQFTRLHTIALTGFLATLGAAGVGAAARRASFAAECVARVDLATLFPPLRHRFVPAGLRLLALPELVVAAGYSLTFGYFAVEAVRAYPGSAGRALGNLLCPMMATALLPVARESVVSVVLGVSYERMVAAHRTASCALLVLIVAHAARMVVERGIEVLSENVETSVGDGSVYGTAAASCFASMGLFAAPPIRRRAWLLFKASHLIAIPAAVTLAVLHARVLFPYVMPPLGLWALDVLLRTIRSARMRVDVSVTRLVGGAVRLDVVSPEEDLSGSRRYAAAAKAGGPPPTGEAAPLQRGGICDVTERIFAWLGLGASRWVSPPGRWAYVCVPAVSVAEWHPLTIVPSRAALTAPLEKQQQQQQQQQHRASSAAPQISFVVGSSAKAPAPGGAVTVPTVSTAAPGSFAAKLLLAAGCKAGGGGLVRSSDGSGIGLGRLSLSLSGRTSQGEPQKKITPITDENEDGSATSGSSSGAARLVLSARLDGPYGGCPLQFDKYDTLVLIAGGAGITPVAGVATHVAALKAGGALPLLQSVRLVWAVRDPRAADTWLPEGLLQPVRAASELFAVSVYVTGRGGASLLSLENAEDGSGASSVGTTVEEAAHHHNGKALRGGNISGRPPVGEIAAQAVAEAKQKRAAAAWRVAVYACGPGGLVDAAHSAAAAAWCHFHSESFLL